MDTLEERFRSDVQEYVDWMLAERPVWATSMGMHGYDNRLDDASPAALEEQNRRIGDYQQRFEKGLASSDLDTRIDAELMTSLTKSSRRDYEQIRSPFRAPQRYIGRALSGCHQLMIRDFAPLGDRLESLAGRMSEVPGLLAQGRKNLERPPRIWTEIAIGTAKGGVHLFEDEIPALAAAEPSVARRVAEASARAADAVKDFLRFLEDDLLPISDGDFACGEEMFNTLLREVHMMEADAGDIERSGWRLIEDTEREFDELSARLGYSGKDRNEVVYEISKHHPKEDEIVSAYAKAMADSRAFIAERDLATLPEGERLIMKENPRYSWHLLPFAAYGPPGPFEEDQVGIFWVTPVDPSLPAKLRKARMRSHPYAKIPIHAVHEGYPGHHLQLVWANKIGSLASKVGCISSLHVEGWAFYTEEMMEQQGFLDDPPVKIFRLKEQLWRACRIVIDVGIQTRGLSLDDAAQLLVDRAGFEKRDAVSEINRYTLAPTQPMSYLIGKLELMKTAEDYRRRKGPDFELKTFQDEVLMCGSLPPKLIRQKLFAS